MSDFIFRAGELTREIALRGKSQKEFAARARLNKNTIVKACQGKPLDPLSWGKIIVALGEIPVAKVPVGMEEKSA